MNALTVKNLISILERYDPEAPVRVVHGNKDVAFVAPGLLGVGESLFGPPGNFAGPFLHTEEVSDDLKPKAVKGGK